MWTLFAILLALWTAGLFLGVTAGNLIHLLLILALVLLVLQWYSRPPAAQDGDGEDPRPSRGRG